MTLLSSDMLPSTDISPLKPNKEDPRKPQMSAQIEFDCVENSCENNIKFNLLDLKKNSGRITCSDCRRLYQLDKDFLQKLEKLRLLILAVRDAEDILGDCNIAIVTPAGEVKLPYRLLLTRLNTLVSFDCNGKKLEFNFRVEPLNNATFK